MIDLPTNKGLDISNLSKCFNNISNSYKYYWLLSILDHVIYSEELYISLDQISMSMISKVWYPLDYYKLSFGKQDGFKELSTLISTKVKIDNSVNSSSLLKQIENKLSPVVTAKLRNNIKVGLKRWVTFRFLTPFFKSQVKGLRDQEVNNIISLLSNSAQYKDLVPYSIESDGITLNKKWRDYFLEHHSILKGFINWHLIKFLQKNNPNVIGLTEKLEKPTKRDLKVAKVYWTKYLNSYSLTCIYSDQTINASSFSLDHFVPWSYIAHDQIWNIIPTTKIINSTKSDNLPSLEHYLNSFCNIHYDAFKYHVLKKNYKLLEDYTILFNNYNLHEIDFATFKKVLSTEISNHCRIAENLGFRPMYVFSTSYTDLGLY